MKRLVLFPYKMSSMSCKRLAHTLRDMGANVLRVYPNRHYRPRSNDLIVNWGNSKQPNWYEEVPSQVLNPTEYVGLACNKLTTLDLLGSAQVNIPIWMTDKTIAKMWTDQGDKIFCRTKLSGHSGQGIIVATTPEEVVDAPLYTLQFPKTHEYRVHVFNGMVLDVQEKRKRAGTGGRASSLIWNHGNDFVYARAGVNPPPTVLGAAVGAVEALGLDFGGVDVGYNQEDLTCAVFEVNTAVGLHGTTLKKYAEKLYELARH